MERGSVAGPYCACPTQAESANEQYPSRQQQEPNREREQWNEWEQGAHLPEDVNIRRIATVLDGDPATFLRHAKRPVPSYLLVHDEAWATRTFLRALYKAKSCVEFLDAAQAIWQEYVFQQTHLRPHLRIDRAYSQVLEMVRLYLDEKQQVQLARHIVRHKNDDELEKYVDEALEFRQQVQTRFRTLATTQLSPALHSALEELGIVAGRFDGLTSEMKTVFGKIGLRELEPITDPDLFIYQLSEHFEVVKRLLPELTTLYQNLTEAATKVTSAYNDTIARKLQTHELIFQLCEMVARLERRVATITDQPQRILGELEEALEQQRKRSKPKRFASPARRKRSAGG